MKSTTNKFKDFEDDFNNYLSKQFDRKFEISFYIVNTLLLVSSIIIFICFSV